MKRFAPAIVVALLLLTAGIVWIFRANPVAQTGSRSAGPANEPVAASAPSAASVPSPGSAPVSSPVALPPGTPAPSAAFRKFLADEAKELDSTHTDVSGAEERMRKLVASLTLADIGYASALVTGMKGPANERIVAAYAVSQAVATLPAGPGQDAAREAAGKIIGQPFHSDRAQPHSEDEVLNAQAKSFALMNVDALAERAVKDPAAREDLARLARDARDPFVQQYIAEKLHRLPPR